MKVCTFAIRLPVLTGASLSCRRIFKIMLGPLRLNFLKGNRHRRLEKALTEIWDLIAFNQNVSFCMGKAMQHLADIIFVQMGNITLLRRDAYLDHLKQGLKPDTWCALRNSPLNS